MTFCITVFWFLALAIILFVAGAVSTLVYEALLEREHDKKASQTAETLVNEINYTIAKIRRKK